MRKIIQHILNTQAGSSARARLRAAGDQARDIEDWTRAAEAYRNYLIKRPQDAAIWIQYGHALKEQGLYADAEKAYRQSIAHTPEDDDAHLQLGHVLKLQGRLEEAGGAYGRSLELKPTPAAFAELQELRKLGVHVDTQLLLPDSPANAIFFEISDLLIYLNAHLMLSGIQRVQVGILQQLLWDHDGSSNSEFVFVRSRNDIDSFWQLDPLLLKSLVGYCVGDVVERDRLNTMLSQIEQTAIVAHPAQGSVYFIMGAFWIHGDVARYAKLKAAGVRVGIYIYDLIPLSHPEYCDTQLVGDFVLSLSDGLSIFDFVLAISEFSAQAMRGFITRYKLREIPVKSVLLAHELTDKKRCKAKSKWSGALEQLRGRPYVMSVSTIEARKNHSYLIEVWKLLLREGLEPPNLVFVGRAGWRVNDFMEQLRATDFLDGRVHILHNLSDADLEMLYQNCLFTAFPSFVEGWGLPVGESLAAGQVCVASNTSSIPEVGGDLVDYMDPYNVRNGVEVFRRLMIDQAYLEQRRNNIRRNFRPRSWKTVTTDLLDKIAQIRSESGVSWRAPLLLPGEVFRPADLRMGHMVPRNYPSRPLRLILSEGWYTAESFGACMRGREAKLEFSTELEFGTEVVVYMILAGTETHENARALIFSDSVDGNWRAAKTYPPKSLDFQVVMPLTNGGIFAIRLLGKVNKSGNVVLQFRIDKDVPSMSELDHRGLSLGFVKLAYAPRADAAIRVDIVDALDRSETAA